MDRTKLLVIMGIAAGLLILITAVTVVSVQNEEVALRNQVEAQQQTLESYHDAMWKILKQKAGVSDEYKKTFTEIYPKLIEGRYDQGDGSLMKWIQEDNPAFDTALYQDLSRSIEAQRVAFHREQKQLVDLQREHKTLIETFPGKLILSDKKPVEITIVSSTRSKQAIATGIDDDVSLF